MPLLRARRRRPSAEQDRVVDRLRLSGMHCTVSCGFFVQEGRAVEVRGNQLSKANSGYVCPRGHLMLQQLYDPDRIKVPMKRTNPKKGRGSDPKFVPITWDEALDTIADKMMELRRANGT